MSSKAAIVASQYTPAAQGHLAAVQAGTVDLDEAAEARDLVHADGVHPVEAVCRDAGYGHLICCPVHLAEIHLAARTKGE